MFPRNPTRWAMENIAKLNRVAVEGVEMRTHSASRYSCSSSHRRRSRRCSCGRPNELDAAVRTVGAALRGRPWFVSGVHEGTARIWRTRFQARGGHGGPPLQYVPHTPSQRKLALERNTRKQKAQ